MQQAHSTGFLDPRNDGAFYRLALFFLLYSCGGNNNYYLFSATQPPWVVARLPTSTPSTAVRDERRRRIRFSEKMMKLIVLALALVATTTSVNGHAVELTKSNFDATVHDSGKNAFVKFLAPW